MRTTSGPLYALPYTHELADTTVIWERHHSAAEWADQVRGAFDWLLAEAERSGGRVFGLALHPWLVGQPHRIAALETVLAHVTAPDGVWHATAGEIVAVFREEVP